MTTHTWEAVGGGSPIHEAVKPDACLDALALAKCYTVPVQMSCMTHWCRSCDLAAASALGTRRACKLMTCRALQAPCSAFENCILQCCVLAGPSSGRVGVVQHFCPLSQCLLLSFLKPWVYSGAPMNESPAGTSAGRHRKRVHPAHGSTCAMADTAGFTAGLVALTILHQTWLRPGLHTFGVPSSDNVDSMLLSTTPSSIASF